ncbi:MAG: sodium ion-translocating decarboxylase subunit beta [Verrucomicrobiota bacterium]
MLQSLYEFIQISGFLQITWQMAVMWIIALFLLYLAIYRNFEPLLLVPIAFGALLANLPTQGLVNEPAGEVFAPVAGIVERVDFVPNAQVEEGAAVLTIRQEDGTRTQVVTEARGTVTDVYFQVGDRVEKDAPLARLYGTEAGGLFYYLYKGIDWEIFPPLIFLGVGALTDFGPLIANPRMLLLGAAAQLGVIVTFLGASMMQFTSGESASIAIIGGADGPTAIFTSAKLAPELLPAIAVSAYSYMALVPLIQPPIMRLLTTKEQRKIRMKSLRPVGKEEKLIFALVVTLFCILMVPSAAALIGMLMFGNFLRECGVTARLVQAAQNELINVVTIFLGASVGITMTGERFLQSETLGILALGIVAFAISTAGGILMAHLMNLFSATKINPLIGSAGVSAVPMAARVSQIEGQRYDPSNFLLMHAMGPNVAGVIGTALIAGYFITTLQ